MKLLGVLFFTLLHWALILFTTTYIFLRSSPAYDTLYFTAVCGIMASWRFSGDECLISYLEKISLHESYKYGTDKSLPFTDLLFTENLRGYVLFFLSLLTLYNLVRMCLLYNIPLPVIATLLIFYTTPIMSTVYQLLSATLQQADFSTEEE